MIKNKKPSIENIRINLDDYREVFPAHLSDDDLLEYLPTVPLVSSRDGTVNIMTGDHETEPEHRYGLKTYDMSDVVGRAGILMNGEGKLPTHIGWRDTKHGVAGFVIDRSGSALRAPVGIITPDDKVVRLRRSIALAVRHPLIGATIKATRKNDAYNKNRAPKDGALTLV